MRPAFPLLALIITLLAPYWFGLIDAQNDQLSAEEAALRDQALNAIMAYNDLSTRTLRIIETASSNFQLSRPTAPVYAT